MSTVTRARRKTAARPARKGKTLPPRSKVKTADTWDLTLMYVDDAAWEKNFVEWSDGVAGYERFRGKLGDSAQTLAAALKFDADIDRQGERLGSYAYLK